MNLSRVCAIFLRQLYLIKSNPVRLTGIFLWILLDIVQWGFISKYLETFGQATFSFITVILGAVILWGFLTRIQHGVMVAFLEDIWSRNFLNFFASPLKVGEYLAGLITTSVTTGALGFLAMIMLAGLAFGYNIFKIGLLLLPALIVLLVFGVAVGTLVAGIIFRLGPAAEWITWPIPLVLSVVAGVYYPIATLPIPLQFVAKLLPPAYIFENLRAVIAAGGAIPGLETSLLTGGGLALAYLAITYKFFVNVYRRNLKTGAIARFSAEDI